MATFPPVDLLSIVVYAALAGVVFMATLRAPANAIVALIASAPFDWSHALGATTITFDKVAIVAAALGLLAGQWRTDVLARGAPRALMLALVAVLGATLLSIAVAHYRGPALRESFKVAQYLLAFCVAAIAWSCDPDRQKLQLAVTLTVSAVVLLALAQEFTGSPSGIWFEGHPYPRIAGPLEGPNQLAGYLGIALPFLIVWALEGTTIATLLPAALTVVALILTLSRSGVFAGIIAAAIVFFVYRRPKVRLPLLAALAIGFAVALFVLINWHASGAIHRFFTFDEVQRSGGVGIRSLLWRAAYTLWESHPLLGVGAGNFELLLPTVGDPGIRTHANSWYLQALVEGGFPLLFATCALVWASIGPFRRAALRNPLALAMCAASVAFAWHGFVDYLVFYPKVAIAWFTLLGVCAADLED